ncbi:MAG: IMPACT family protein [Clostridiales Family XIII bacterium]|jgi:uncharacterized YigZ family protein|nr:IMPACT family protein [Clostridiales Family XIII bacterium]
MRPYLTVAGAGEAEQTVERSRFIGYVRHAETPEECEVFFDEVRRLHRTATHNVPAYALGPAAALQWAGDDGEPRGTSGAPIVHMLVSEGISDTAVIVTRYFGGIKLGTGGLMRAYTGTAKLAIAAAGLAEVAQRLVITVELDYSAYNRVKGESGEFFTLGPATFADKVRTELVTSAEKRTAALAALQAVAPGAVMISEETRVVRTLLE